MSNLYPIGLLVALAIVAMFVYSYLDRKVRLEANPIVTGFIQGVSVSMKHRSLLLNTRWLPSVTAVVAYQSGMALGWLLIGRNASDEEVRLFAYLVAFLAGITALGWIFLAPFWYLHLASVLRQAEAD